jgi:phenylpyruvate tautomerase
MPFIKVQTSIATPERSVVEVMLKSLSTSLAKHTGKPESYACYIEIKSVGKMSPAQTQAMSQDFCEQANAALGVALNRTYIEFADAQGYMWGWNGSTFG